jgi:hypothetical protein
VHLTLCAEKMSVPEHLWRFPTAAAIASLAERFDLPNTVDMQDWEWEVADPARVEEFIEAYEHRQMSDDERFTIMETIIQSCEEQPAALNGNPAWCRTLALLEANIHLHIYSVWYWSDLENDNGDDQWRVTPFLREILNRHKPQFSQQNDAPNALPRNGRS